MNQALTTGMPHTVPQYVGFDHYYASVATTCRGPKNVIFWGCLTRLDSVMPTKTSETSSRSQRGVPQHQQEKQNNKTT